MNARSDQAVLSTPPAAPAPRFDRKFIEDHRLVERYLENKLPLKGARQLEDWCRANPEFLNDLNLSERTHASLKLLERSGSPQDLGEPKPPFWKTPYLPIGLGALCLCCVLALGGLYGKLISLNGRLENAQSLATHGSLSAPKAQHAYRVAPDHAAGIDSARVSFNSKSAELINLNIDMGYSRETLFRAVIDKRDQGRVLVLENLLKDSNGDLKVAFNTSGFEAGLYDVHIEALPPRGIATPAGWLILDAK
ncbi:MAG: hypothetical protein ABSF94_01110 [Steroidobacteraceae bacterium]|jgi:hypothetical protein